MNQGAHYAPEVCRLIVWYEEDIFRHPSHVQRVKASMEKHLAGPWNNSVTLIDVWLTEF